MNHTTKTAQFTQGPWVVDEDYEDEEQQAIGIVKEGHGYIAGIHILASCNNGEGFTAEDRANAALIAAAPAMYDRHKDNHGMVQEALRFLYEGEYEEVKCLLNHIALNSKQAVRQAEGR